MSRKEFSDYHAARAYAQQWANETGFDVGLERNALFHVYVTFLLPRKANRSGHELRCEVVSCETWEKIAAGHGPGAVS